MSVYPHRSLRDIAHDYAFHGAVVLIAAWAITGCRLGNRVTYLPVTDNGSGYYESSAESFNLCVTTTNLSECKLQPTNLIPRSLTNVMTPLIWFQVDKDNATNASIYSAYASSTNDSHFPFTYDSTTSDLTLLAEPQSEPASSTCNDKFNVEAKGKVARMPKYEITVGTEKVPVSGRVTLDFRITESFEGECTDVMDLLYECYMENPACPSDLQSVAKNTFQPYIDAGLITPEKIREVTDIGYEISYK